MNIKSVNDRTTNELFNIGNHQKYSVPLYQREYTWRKSEWEHFFEDLVENERGYFYGTLICIDSDEQSEEEKNYEIIDGQQRLTTLSLLMLALNNIIKSRDWNLSNLESRKYDIYDLRLCDFDRESTDRARLKLQKQNHNNDDYLQLLSENELIETFPHVKNSGNRRICRAYNYFKNRLDDYFRTYDYSKSKLIEFCEKVNSAMFVQINVGGYADANMIFEALNNRGTPLSTIDLIKNILLSTQSEDQLETCYKQWIEILRFLGDEYSIQERFLRHNYNAFRKEYNKPFQTDSNSLQLGARATRSNIYTIYEKVIRRDPKEFIRDITKKASIYSKINLIDFEDVSENIQRSLQHLNRISGVPSHQLLLYLFLNQNELDLDDTMLVEIIDLLTRFFVRRNVTDQPPTRDLDSLFISIISEIRDNGYKGASVYNAISDRLKAVSSDDEIFKSKLSGPIYEENTGAVRFILCYLTELSMTRENRVDLWCKNNANQYLWTIEHIFPQGENIPQAWIDMIADGDKERAKEIREKYVHKLGNLTISAYNSNLGQKSFTEKRDRQKDGKYIGYRNNLSLNEDLKNKDKWTVNDIEERTTKLVDRVVELFKL